MNVAVSLSFSCDSDIPISPKNAFISLSNLSTSNVPFSASQPTCCTCLKSVGVPISSLDIFTFFPPLLFLSALRVPVDEGMLDGWKDGGGWLTAAGGGAGAGPVLTPGGGGGRLWPPIAPLSPRLTVLRCCRFCNFSETAALKLSASASFAKFNPAGQLSVSNV